MSGEHLGHNLQEAFFKTPDLAIVRPALVNPGSSTAVSVVIDDKTRVLVKSARNLDMISASMRSRYAQLGLDMDSEEAPEFIKQLLLQGATADFQLYNHSLRPVQLSEDTRLLRLFYEPADAILAGKELSQAIGDGRIQLGGARGKDWEWAYDDLGKRVGVFIRISGRRLWIPPGEDVISISSEGPDYRSEIDGILKPLPVLEDDKKVFWIGETAVSIALGVSIEGVLDSRILRDLDNPSLDFVGTQTNSFLIDSGTKWPVRVEVKSLTDPRKIPNFARFHFLQNGHSPLV
jgi:hypothetical protein